MNSSVLQCRDKKVSLHILIEMRSGLAPCREIEGQIVRCEAGGSGV